MDLRSGSKDLIVPSLMFMRILQGTFLSSGKPPGRPPDSDLVGEASQSATPNLDPGGIGEMGDRATVLEGLGQLKSEGDLLLASLAPSLFSRDALWEKKNGRINIPTHTCGMGNAKEKIKNMTNIPVDVSSMVSLLSSVDLYCKSQILI